MAAALVFSEKRECNGERKNEAWRCREKKEREGGIGKLKPRCDAGTRSGASNSLPFKAER